MIIADDICKKINETMKIDSLSFHIKKGEITGLLGLNGSGKTTILHILSGILTPDKGYIRISGINPYRKKYENLKQIGYVDGSKSQLWPELMVKDSFENCKHMYNINPKDYKRNLKSLCEYLDMEELLNIPANKLSLGQRIKADFIYGILHNPKILYLDEPTVGLDIISKEKIINLIKEINKKNGTTIIFTNHKLKEIDETCSKIILIDNGKKIYDGELNRLKHIYASQSLLKIKTDKLPDFQDLPIGKYKLENDDLYIYYDESKVNSAAILKHISEQCFMQEIKIKEPTLEQIISRIYDKEF